VARSGADRGAQWPGSRVISAQKANTANAFSLTGFAIPTANLWAATQLGGSLFGLQLSSPGQLGSWGLTKNGPWVKHRGDLDVVHSFVD